LVIYTYNHLWEPVVKLAERLGLKMPMLEQNWLSEADLRNMLDLAGFEWLHTYRVIMFPKWVPILSKFFNRFVARLPVLNNLCMINVILARPIPNPRTADRISVSVVVPCKNEQGNIEAAVRRIPNMGRHTEIIFCDDKSTDGTADEVRRMQRQYPERDIKLIEGPGICKAKNVWTGFEAAHGDVLMILDADLTVMPEELPFFFKAIIEGKGEFINGSRMVYPMQKRAMKVANMLGNKIFGIIFSYLLNQPVKDTLCGTKVLWRSDWERIKLLLDSWGTTDRWGDYELLFGAAKLHLRIVDLPVHYQERVYGETKMTKVFHNGVVMLRMSLAGFLKLKMGF
jgi:glycosyltransferase involved in cell wall biosynthesis